MIVLKISVIFIVYKQTKKYIIMNNTRKAAFKRAQELKRQKIGNTTITTPNVKPNPPKPRRRTDEIYAEMEERLYEEIEMKMLDLSRWNGEGSLFKYRDLVI